MQSDVVWESIYEGWLAKAWLTDAPPLKPRAQPRAASLGFCWHHQIQGTLG